MNRPHSLAALAALFLAGFGATTPPPAQAADRTIVVEFFSNHL